MNKQKNFNLGARISDNKEIIIYEKEKPHIGFVSFISQVWNIFKI